MSECNGICIMGWELIEGASGVAYAHPDCEKHSPRPQKMWVRKSGRWWEVGCQCCGRLISEEWSWRKALAYARRHSWMHDRAGTCECSEGCGRNDSGY